MKKLKELKSLKPAGHYSLATIHNDTIYVSGQLPININTGEKVFGNIETQMEVVLSNLEAILHEVGSSKEKVLRVTVYIPDVQKWDKVNAVYGQFFGEHKPARTVVLSRDLHYGFSVEIDAIAYI